MENPMIYFSIKYCQKEDGKFVDVLPNMAHYFRVFMTTGTEKKWVHDFNMLSKANDFIKRMREAEIKLHEAFVSVLAGEQVMQQESIHAVMETLKREVIRGMK
jgi:hypothetical protein